ncbi:hypothetical protein DFQ28_000882 [Apophysomyces sp. BC1034]|nr:hypothetical protein DFQ30_001321 [Apophysomyces sp. BC1015]KAG0167098.1 hypothetical protein DFQ29_000638 [Apophysomyces sp. BC1021]KAG0183805.1 hypothetical protein DFQ28_000882 [Apophysomyces sp. BC1034]
MKFPTLNKTEKTTLNDDEFDDADSESIIILNGISFTRNEVLICAKNGKLYCIHKKDGVRLWGNKLPTGRFSDIAALFVTDSDTVLAATNGKIACYNLHSGERLWMNNMKGMGFEATSVICTPSRFLAPKVDPPTEDAERDPPAYDTVEEQSVTISCSRGKVMAIDNTTGDTIWKYECPGGGYRLPIALVEPPSAEHGLPYRVVYVGCGQWIYCLRALTGALLWSQKIFQHKLNLGYIAIATPWSSRVVAETHTAFTQFPLAQQRNEED